MKRAYATPMDTPCRKRMKKETEECLKVYCRIRPLIQDEPLCVKVISDTLVRLRLQNSNKSGKQYTFKKIFPHCSTQKEVFDEVASPLVKQLIHGENGLLFTYGVTGSGKTYTMMGNKQNVGVMPRCLDALFSSIKDQSDKMNGFEVQTKEDAEQDRESYLRRNNMTKRRKDNSQEDLLSTRSKDGTRISIKEDYAYAVFITYVEVYNNFVYDLLDTGFENESCKKPQSKDIRDDGSGKMYVHGTTEVEVKSTEDALEMLNKGDQRKQMACTMLNVDSSRSHSVFTIRLVQSPLNATGDTIVQEKHMIRVSQLSLVDLAGSERTDRTGNTGQRLYESSKINQALSVLRKCLETLGRNQKSSAQKMVPYREHKITFLLKNFFQGDGDIRMIACVNPSMKNANENAFVMQFAKGAQDIMVKSTSLKTHEPTLEKKIESLEQKLISLERDKKAANAKHEYDTQKIESLEQKLISFERDKKAANANHEYDTHKVETLKQKLTSPERDVESANARHEYDTHKIESLEQKLISLERDTKAANAKHEYDTHKIETLEQKLTSLERDVESANARHKYDMQKIQSFEQKLISLERDKKDAKGKTLKKLTSLERDVESANARHEYDTQKFQCANCFAEFSKKYNLERHITRQQHKLQTIPAFLQQMIPVNHKSSESVTLISCTCDKDKSNSFKAEFIIGPCNDSEAEQTVASRWIQEFAKKNHCNYVRREAKLRGKFTSSQKREVYRCHHFGPSQGQNRKKMLKGTNCPSVILIHTKRSSSCTYMKVRLHFNHNHSLTSTNIVRFNKPPEELKKVFITMFENGATPAEALLNYQIQIKCQFDDDLDYTQQVKDRANVPDYDWIRHLFNSTFVKKKGSTH